MITLSAYPSSFINNKVLIQIKDNLNSQLQRDPSTRRFSIQDYRDLVSYIEDYLKKENVYQLLFPYFKWIYIRYAKGELGMVEDIISKVIPRLVMHKKLSNKKVLKPNEKDINRIKSGRELELLIDKYESTKAEEGNRDEEFFNSNQAELYYDSPKLRVVIPNTWEASKYFGGKRKEWDKGVLSGWCTVGNERDFNYYKSNGELYIIFFKDKKVRIQYFYPRDWRDIGIEIQDIKSEDINIEDIKKIVKKYPDLKKAFKGKVGFDPNPSEAEQLKVIRYSISDIAYIGNLTEKVQLFLIELDTHIGFINNPTEKVQLKMIEKDGTHIGFIKKPTEKVQLKAIEIDPYNISLIKKPTEKVQLKAIENNPDTIRCINNPTEKVQLKVIKDNDSYMRYIDKPTKKVIKLYEKL